MGHDELVRSLRKKADEQVKSIWAKAEEEGGQLREQARLESDRVKKEFEKEIEAQIGAEDKALLKDAMDRARGIRLLAEKELSERLFALALSCLGELREEGYKGVFRSLYAELPSKKWAKVEVNIADAKPAGELFEEAVIETVDNISGGMRAVSGNGKICVTNTFEKRLERSWEDLLPMLMKDIYREIS